METGKKIIFNINGGAGKNIMAISVVNALRKKNPDSEIVVTSPYPAVWMQNPDIQSVIDLEKSPTFYVDLIKNANVEIFKKDPYWEEDFIYRRKHLIDVWCNICGVTWDKKPPEIKITEAEKKQVQTKLPEGKLFFIQTNGGAKNQKYPISWSRDLPLNTAQKIVDKMNAEGYTTVHLRREDQPALQNVIRPSLNLREMITAISFSDKRLFIDSIAQHAAAGLNLPSTVVWISNDPKVFGYDLHKNIKPKLEPAFRHNLDSYLEKYDITGNPHQCPFDTTEIFDTEELLSLLLDK